MKFQYRQIAAAIFGLLCLATSTIVLAETRITWLGHGAFKIQTPSGRVLITDPWILHPLNPNAVADFRKLNSLDLILITHGHANAVGDALELAKRFGGKLLVSSQLKRGFIANKKVPKKYFTPEAIVGIGTPLSYFDDEVRVTLMPAEHRAVSEHPDDGAMRNSTAYAIPYTLVIEIKGGPTIFHAGDSQLLEDEFEEIAKRYKVDIMMVGIGGKFVSSPSEAAEMVEIIKPRIAIPMRFGGVPGMNGTPAEFSEELRKVKAAALMQELKPGETLKFP